MEGSEAGDRGQQGAPPPPDQQRLTSLVVVAGAVILIGLVSFALYRRSHQTPQVAEPVPAEAGETPGPDAGAAAGSPAGGTPIAAPIPVRLSPEASIIAERYRCICSCNDPLNVCTCTRTPGSRDMKTYVQELVSQKKSGQEVDAAMIERYGAAVLLSNPPVPAVPEPKKR